MSGIFIAFIVIPSQIKLAFIVALIVLALLLILKLGFIPAKLYPYLVRLRQRLPYSVSPDVYSPVRKDRGQAQHSVKDSKFKKISKEDIVAKLEDSLANETTKDSLLKLVKKAEEASKKGVSGLGTHNNSMIIFSGPSGVGKTSVAKILGEIFHSVGAIPASTSCLLKKGELDNGNPGTYIKSETSNYLGGVVIIDNSDWLISPDDKLGTKYISNVGQSLAEIAESRPHDFIFIFTGSSERMEHMLADPDNKTWLNAFFRVHFELETLDDDEMSNLVVRYLSEQGWQVKSDAIDTIEKIIRLERCNGSEFSNAHTAKQLVDNLIMFKDGQDINQGEYLITFKDIEEVYNEYR